MKLHGMNCAISASKVGSGSLSIDFEVLLEAMTAKERAALRAMLAKRAKRDRELMEA